MKRTYITNLQNRSGAFLEASRIIAKYGGNITRVNYNKSVDEHFLFVDVDGGEEILKKITQEMSNAGFLAKPRTAQSVLLIEFKIKDESGQLVPILEIIDKYNINITYLNSEENGTEYQYFKMGLLITEPDVIKRLLDELSHYCTTRIIEYDKTEKILDNTVFYISFANELSKKLKLKHKQTDALVVETNKIMQMLDEGDNSPYKVFEYIGKFADYIARHKDNDFNLRISKMQLTDDISFYAMEPPCGSNTYIFHNGNKLLFVDCGFACYRKEMLNMLRSMFEDFDSMHKRCVITHADTDHCGLLNLFDVVYVTQTSYKNFLCEIEGIPSIREENPAHAPYCRISRIITAYEPPEPTRLHTFECSKESDTPLSMLGNISFGDIKLEVLAGAGGHLDGEVLLISKEHKLIFTGDVIVNLNGFTDDQKSFNELAPYLMTSVDMYPEKASAFRKKVFEYIEGTGYLICPGHGACFRKTT